MMKRGIALPGCGDHAAGITSQCTGRQGGRQNWKKPYVSLGADLNAQERATVLELLGITEDDLKNYTVATITNQDEHDYLDAYLDKSVIGSRALSSVLVEGKTDGNGIKVTTHNISYCTTGMYQNALVTAGIKDADIVVAGPFKISGTAALVGAIKSYENMTGEKVEQEMWTQPPMSWSSQESWLRMWETARRQSSLWARSRKGRGGPEHVRG